MPGVKALAALTGACALAALCVVGFGSNAKAQGVCQAGDTPVSISSYAYSPSPLQIAPGSSVCWTNNDPVPHTVTSNTGAFDSQSMGPGESFRHTFASSGTFDYHCGVPGHRNTV